MKQYVTFDELVEYLDTIENGKRDKRRRKLISYLCGVRDDSVSKGYMLTIGVMIDILLIYSKNYTLNYFDIKLLEKDGDWNFVHRCSLMHYDENEKAVKKTFIDPELCNCLWSAFKYTIDYVLSKDS